MYQFAPLKIEFNELFNNIGVHFLDISSSLFVIRDCELVIVELLHPDLIQVIFTRLGKQDLLFASVAYVVQFP